jgi:hypothetical protein
VHDVQIVIQEITQTELMSSPPAPFAVDAIYEQAMYEDFPDYEYLDFGRSTEGDGSILNGGLIAQKEGFGGRAICYDTYEWTL